METALPRGGWEEKIIKEEKEEEKAWKCSVETEEDEGSFHDEFYWKEVDKEAVKGEFISKIVPISTYFGLGADQETQEVFAENEQEVYAKS